MIYTIGPPRTYVGRFLKRWYRAALDSYTLPANWRTKPRLPIREQDLHEVLTRLNKVMWRES